MQLRGNVFSGKSEGAKFVRLPWVKKQVQEKLGFTPYPGTLNIRLDQESIELKETLVKTTGIEISPAPSFCQGRLFRACLADKVKCAIVVPEVAGYPKDIVEIVAPTNLRRRLHLFDGMNVDIKIPA